jgi:HEPN domain-containing protein
MLKFPCEMPGLRDAMVLHAQQCMEKLLKAWMIQLGQTVDKIHGLAVLSGQLEAVLLRSSGPVFNSHRGWRESCGRVVP